MCGSTSPGVTDAAAGVEPGEPRRAGSRSASSAASTVGARPDRDDPALPAARRPARPARRVRRPSAAIEPRDVALRRARARTPPASVTTSRRPDDQQARRVGSSLATALDEPERAAGSRRRPAAARGGLESQLEGLQRARSRAAGGTPAAAASRRSTGSLGRRAGAVGDGEEGGQRREPDELGLGELDAVLGGELADRLPDQPQRRRRGSRAGSSRPGAAGCRARLLDPEPVGLDLAAARRRTRGRGGRSAWRARRRPSRG